LPTITAEVVIAGPDVVQPVALENPVLACGGTKGLRVGMAVLEATITVKGTVENVRIIRSLSPDTDAALITCVAKWRYTPATFKGKPVPVQLTIAVNLCA
jgi:TonB family protein